MASKSAAEICVKDLMSTHIVTLHAGATVHEALQLMVENRVSALPVVDKNDRCVGIISTTDLVQLTYDIDDDVVRSDPLDPSSRRRLVEKLIHAVGGEPISSYMSEQVVTCGESQTLKAAARLMLKNQIHHLPIVNSDEAVVGILSTMDVLADYTE